MVNKSGNTSINGQEKLTVDVIFDKIREVDPQDSKGDAAIARKLGLSKSAPGQSRVNNTVPYAPLVEYCLRSGVDLNWLFNNEVKLPRKAAIQGSERNNEEEISSSQSNILEAVILVTPIMEKYGVPRNGRGFEVMLSAYNKYHARAEVDTNEILELVAKSYASNR